MLCHSQYPLARLFTAQNEECFLEGLAGFMRELGGVPCQVIFDNARVAVRSGSGAGAQLNERYARLAAHYGFRAVSCNAHAGREKGLVEGLVGCIRRNFAAAQEREYATLEEAQAGLRQFLKRRAQSVLRGRERSIAADFERERPHLLALPEHEPEVTACRSVRVSAFSRVRFESNEYSGLTAMKASC